MRAEYVEGEYVLRLNRGELILLVDCLGAAHDLIPSDEHFKVSIGEERQKVLAFASALADFARSVPPERDEGYYDSGL